MQWYKSLFGTIRSRVRSSLVKLIGGDGEPEFDDEGDNKGYDEYWKFDEFKGNDVSVFVSVKYDEDNKEANAIWEAINKRMDSQRKYKREARLKQEIENYRISNQQMRARMSDVRCLYRINHCDKVF
ncbi:hypothetical protein CDL15_Pgr026921 [Punica granatum]|uniref:PRP1 splicing factor N-terminal domain-containing protein n=1 Tax=Punica granatum TaxID=22663 RepID=A0A218XYX4_PUNGR|nr:hypothetical protein CDL15_Pgr026921 [Punica granatum]